MRCLTKNCKGCSSPAENNFHTECSHSNFISNLAASFVETIFLPLLSLVAPYHHVSYKFGPFSHSLPYNLKDLAAKSPICINKCHILRVFLLHHLIIYNKTMNAKNLFSPQYHLQNTCWYALNNYVYLSTFFTTIEKYTLCVCVMYK